MLPGLAVYRALYLMMEDSAALVGSALIELGSAVAIGLTGGRAVHRRVSRPAPVRTGRSGAPRDPPVPRPLPLTGRRQSCHSQETRISSINGPAACCWLLAVEKVITYNLPPCSTHRWVWETSTSLLVRVTT